MFREYCLRVYNVCMINFLALNTYTIRSVLKIDNGYTWTTYWAKVRVRESTENTISVSLLLEARLFLKVNDILYQNRSLTQGGCNTKQHCTILNRFQLSE